MTRLVILQSSYIPWKGVFDLANESDLFIFLDDVQFTNRDWRSRNRIKTQHGLKWLTVPVGSNRSLLINDVRIPDPKWQQKHYATLVDTFCKCPYFAEYSYLLDIIYQSTVWSSLSQLNQFATVEIAKALGIKTEFQDSAVFESSGVKEDKLLDLIGKTGASTYISGPSAKAYICEERFIDAGVELIWKDYSGYPEYPQRFPPFVGAVTILDLLFNTGPDAPYYIWGWRTGGR